MVVTIYGLSPIGQNLIEFFPHWGNITYPFKALTVDDGSCIHLPKYGSIGIIYFITSK